MSLLSRPRRALLVLIVYGLAVPIASGQPRLVPKENPGRPPTSAPGNLGSGFTGSGGCHGGFTGMGFTNIGGGFNIGFLPRISPGTPTINLVPPPIFGPALRPWP